MRIIIRKQGELQGHQLVFDESITIGAVKKTYSTMFGIDDVSDRALINNDVELDDNKTLEECRIKADDILILSSRTVSKATNPQRGQVKTLWSCFNLESSMYGGVLALLGAAMYFRSFGKYVDLSKHISTDSYEGVSMTIYSTTRFPEVSSVKNCIILAIPLFIFGSTMSALAAYYDKSYTNSGK